MRYIFSDNAAYAKCQVIPLGLMAHSHCMGPGLGQGQGTRNRTGIIEDNRSGSCSTVRAV